MKRATLAITGLSLVLIGALIGQWMHDSSPSPSDADALKTLESAYDVIRSSYVEPVPAESLAASSITGMVETLDPFSVYISPRRMKQVEEAFSGSFEGIGISYELIGGPGSRDTIVVMSVVSGGPSAKAGVRAGDRIVEVSGESALGWSHQTVQRRLKGPEGTTVSVTLRRPGHSTLLERSITRDTVPLETVDAAYMMDPQTGYIRLNRFARTTHQEISDALASLKADGMTRLILDLRGNAGGLMSMAQKVADEFLVEGQLIVRSRSRHDEYGGAHYATDEGQFQDEPLIVLVDEHSASASEIVAGALQDHDRALLIGRRTFGKGLVQRQFDLTGGSGLRLTVARFYTPSGRLLQRPGDRSRHSSGAQVDTGSVPVDTQVPDSLLYHTDAGRPVVGGGGIRPDRIVADSIRNPYRRAVTAQGLVRDFARVWADARADSLRRRWGGRPEAFATDFALPSTVYPAFVRYAEQHGVRGGQLSRERGNGENEVQSFPSPNPAVERGEVQRARSTIETAIKAHLGQRLFGTSMRIRLQNTIDPVVRTAQRSWHDAQAWAKRYPIANK